jgi:hypothetical protein
VGFAVGRSCPVDSAQPGDFEEAPVARQDAGGLSASIVGSLVGRACALEQARSLCQALRLAWQPTKPVAGFYPPLINTGRNITPATVFNE